MQEIIWLSNSARARISLCCPAVSERLSREISSPDGLEFDTKTARSSGSQGTSISMYHFPSAQLVALSTDFFVEQQEQKN